MKKIFLSSLCCFLYLFCLFLSPAFSQTSDARKTLEGCIEEVLATLRSPEFQNVQTRDKAIDKIDARIRDVFDFAQFSARTVGPRWSGFTPEQKANFQDAFADLLRATYLDKLKTYSGEKVIFTGETTSKKGDKVGIATSIELKDKTIPVVYKMIHTDQGWAVYDVVIEGMSLVQNYRTQFQDILASQTPEQLTERVRLQARKMRENPVPS